MSEQLRHAGAMLSNCAFNLAQRKPGEPLTEADIRALDDCRRAWDAALSTHHAAPGAPQAAADEDEQLSDEELPGMWSNSDLSGGETDCVPAHQQEASGAQPIGHVRFVAHRKAPDVEWAANVEIHNGAALYTSPRAAATAPAGGVTPGAYLRKKAEDYATAHGSDDMGGLSFGSGAHAEVKMDHYNNLLELAEELDALTTAARAAEPADLNAIEKYRMQMAGICTAALGHWKEGDSIHPDYDTPALHDVARLYSKYDVLFHAADRLALIDWAVGRWHTEVANRPLVNKHRRSLDDVWRQVLRHLGVDDRARLGLTHDELLAASPTPPTGTSKEGEIEAYAMRMSWNDQSPDDKAHYLKVAKSAKATTSQGEGA